MSAFGQWVCNPQTITVQGSHSMKTYHPGYIAISSLSSTVSCVCLTKGGGELHTRTQTQGKEADEEQGEACSAAAFKIKT